MANKNAELQRLTGIYKNILKNANVTLIEGRGKVSQCFLFKFGHKHTFSKPCDACFVKGFIFL